MASLLRILLLEKADDAQLITHALQRAGLNFEAHRLEKQPALEQAIQHDNWDLILGSHQLPDCPPEAILKLIRIKDPETPFILATRTISKDRLSALFAAGINNHIDLDNLYLLAPIIQRELTGASLKRHQTRSRKRLHRHAKGYREVLDSAPIPMLLIANRKILYQNQQAKRILGYTGHDLTRENQLQDIFVDPPDSPVWRILNNPQQASGTLETTLVTHDGKELQVEAWSSPSNAFDKATTVLTFHDISNRLHEKTQLKLAANVFEYTREGVAVLDKDKRILAINPAFSMITGYSQAEVVGQQPGFLNCEENSSAFYAELWKSLEREHSWRGEIWNRRKSGQVYPEWLTITSVPDEHGATSQYVAVFSDISSIKQSQTQLEHLAHHDPLTDLPNRTLFEDRLEHAIATAKRENRHLAVMFLDLDRFKNINDSLGHAVGDALLVQVANRLLGMLRENDTAARLGGDEFTILIENLDDPNYAAIIATKMQNQFKEPFEIFGRRLHVTASIGISLYPEDGKNVGNLTKNADAAMYQAKESGRNSFRFYTSELTHSAYERLLLETELRSAIREHQLLLYYQPQFSIETGGMIGAEALLRWRHPRMGVISPEKFIPLAEETGMIHEIGHWSLEQVCRQTRKWSGLGLFTGRMGINLSVRQIMQSDLILRFEEIIKKTGCPPKQLQFEVTEGIFMGQKELSVPVLDVFKQLGVSIAIDDFGTGYSSLSYLKHLPIDKLKIDRNFIKNMPNDNDDIAIVQAIISLGQTLDLEIIAEGVETQGQQKLLEKMGCKEVQGFLYSEPLSVEEFERRFTDGKGQTLLQNNAN